MRPISKVSVVAGLAWGLAIVLGAPGRAGADEALHETVPMQPGGRLVVDLERGDVTIASHDVAEVQIDALATGLSSWFYDFELATSPKEVRLRGDLSFWRPRLLPDPEVRVQIWVPREFSVRLDTDRGAVVVSGVSGAIEAESSRGSIDVDHLAGRASLHTRRGEIRISTVEGDLRAKTSRGAIAVDEVTGSVDVETSRGRVDVSAVEGRLRVRTSRGAIEVHDARGEVDAETSRGPIALHDVHGPVRAHTSRGEIFARITTVAAGDLESSRGAIHLEVPADAGIDLDAETSNGRIDIGDAIEVRGERRGDRVVARLNGGGERLRVRTSRDDIRIRHP